MGPKTILYVHGIRHDDPDQRWHEALDAAVRRLGTEDLAARGYTVLAPSYLDLLEADELPPPEDELAETYVRAPDETYERAATNYFVALSELERSLGAQALSRGRTLSRLPDEGAVKQLMSWVRRLEQADRYVKESSRRQAILSRLAACLPTSGDLVVLGHSLGSVVAADLVYYVPANVRVRLLVTLGSPLSRDVLRDHVLHKRNRFPYEHLGPWLNVVGVNDVICGGRGVNMHFPEVLDVHIDSGSMLAQAEAHSAPAYLDSSVIAHAIEWVDSRAERGAEEPSVAAVIQDEVLPAVVRAQYLLRLEQQAPKGDQRARLASAREYLGSTVSDRLRSAGHDHLLLDRLLLDNHGVLQTAGDRTHDLTMLTVIYLSNPLEPLVIEFDSETRAAALGELALDLGVPRAWAETVIDCARRARAAHGDRSVLGKRVGLAVAGALAIAALPALVLAAAPAGLAGGAAFIAGLAALGPGGVAGGLAVVGAVGGAGGGAVAAAALLQGSPAVVAENVIALQTLAAASQHLRCAPAHHREWTTLQQMARAITDERDTLLRYSDPESSPITSSNAKLAMIERALEWMNSHGLAPTALTSGGAAEDG